MGNGRAIVKVILRGSPPSNPTQWRATMPIINIRLYFYRNTTLETTKSPLSHQCVFMFVTLVVVEISLDQLCSVPSFLSIKLHDITAKQPPLRCGCTGLRPIPPRKGTRSRGERHVVSAERETTRGTGTPQEQNVARYRNQPKQQNLDAVRGGDNNSCASPATTSA